MNNCNDKFRTGLGWMDDQHKELIRMLSRLQAFVEDGKSDLSMDELLGFLSRYVEEHFNCEVNEMEKYGYLDKKDHIAEHNRFIYTLNVMEEEFQRGGASRYLAGRIKRDLLDWLVNHIGGTDRLLAEFVLTHKEKTKRDNKNTDPDNLNFLQLVVL